MQKKTIDKKRLLEIYTSGKTPLEMAVVLNISKSTLWHMVKKFNIPTNRSRLLKPDIGKTFGRLTVVGKVKDEKYNNTWEFKCKCGTIKRLSLSTVMNGDTKSCGCLKAEAIKKAHWTGYEEISGRYWSATKENAENRRNIVFNLDIKYAWDIFLKQDRKCAISGLPLSFNKNNKDTYMTSLDRINPNLGYIFNNVQWVVLEINYMKRSMADVEFISLCKIIYDNFRNITVKNNINA